MEDVAAARSTVDDQFLHACERREAAADEQLVPAAPVLRLQQHRPALLVAAGAQARALQLEQGLEPEHLRVVRHQVREHARQAQGLQAELGTGPVRTGAGGVPLVEDHRAPDRRALARRPRRARRPPRAGRAARRGGGGVPRRGRAHPERGGAPDPARAAAVSGVARRLRLATASLSHGATRSSTGAGRAARGQQASRAAGAHLSARDRRPAPLGSRGTSGRGGGRAGPRSAAPPGSAARRGCRQPC